MADGIITLLQKKIDALDDILDVTQAQHQLILGEDMGALMDNIERRQRLIDAVDELDAVIAGLSESNEHERAVVERAMQDIRAQLMDISEQDKRNEAAATARLESYKKELKATGEYMRVIEGYIEPMFPAETYRVEKKK